MAGYDSVSPRPLLVHLELEGPVAHERVELPERAVVEQLLHALARCQLALGMLLLDRVLGCGVDRLEAQLLELGELLFVGFGDLLAHLRRPMVLRLRQIHSRIGPKVRISATSIAASVPTT